ncbi:hypothetical protein KCV03_g203, partial [Aureobasidium melanogenum]
MVKPIEVPSCAHVLNTAPPKACDIHTDTLKKLFVVVSTMFLRRTSLQTNAGMVATPMIKSEMVVAVLMLLTSAESVLRYCQS